MPYSQMRSLVRHLATEAVKELETTELCLIADLRGYKMMRAEYRAVSEKVIITDLRGR
jgi:hypothetical protein